MRNEVLDKQVNDFLQRLAQRGGGVEKVKFAISENVTKVMLFYEDPSFKPDSESSDLSSSR